MADTKSFIQLAEEAEKFIKIQKEEIDKKNKSISMRTGRVKKQEQQALEKEKQLKEWETALNAKYEEISRIENAKFLELRANQDNERAGQKLAEAQKLSKQAEEMMAEAKAMKEEIYKREEKCTIREKGMRERIKNEVAQGLMAGFMGKK